MSSNALEVQGTEIKIGTGPMTYITIPEVKSFSGPGGSAEVIDTTDLLSTSKEKRMGLPDEGQLEFTIMYLPKDAAHMALRTARQSRERTAFKLVFTDQSPKTEWSFNAFVTGFSVSGAVDGVIEAQVTLEITGAIVEA